MTAAAQAAPAEQPLPLSLLAGQEPAFVVAGTIVRRRPWAAPLWCAAMQAQTRRPDALLVVVDEPSSADDTVFHWFCTLNLSDLPYRILPSLLPPSPGWSRGTRASGWREPGEGSPERYCETHLAKLRNWWAERALELWPQATHLWSCDSDVAPDPDVLELLLAAEKDVCGAVVRNGKYAFNFMSGSSQDMTGDGQFKNWQPARSAQEHIWLMEWKEPFRVTMTGACALYSRSALERGLRWQPHPRGEDIGLAIQARELGIELWVEPRARTRHYFDGPEKEPLR